MNPRDDKTAEARIAAGVAYQLEAPLATVVAGMRAALRAVDVSDDDLGAWTALREALEAAERMQETVGGLRAFTTAPEDTVTPVSVHEALELAIELAAKDIDARAILVRRYAAVPAVHASIPRLARIFVNVLRNAADAIPPWLPLANTISVTTALDEDGRVAVEIGDTGVGIEPEELPYVFDPFYSTELRGGAPGLGLAAARALALELGGDITAQSVAGRGSRFRVTLPAAEPSEDTAPTLLPLYITETLPPRRVLAVARTHEAARQLGRNLDGDGTRLTHATYDEALESLSLGDLPDLIVFEHDHRVRDGFRDRLRRLAPEVLGRAFELGVRSSGSGVYLRANLARTGSE